MKALALAALAGCSFALDRAPSPLPPPGVKIECDSGVVAPVIDTTFALAGLGFDAYVAHYLATTHDDGAGLALIPAIPITVVALAYGIGAIRGWYVVRECSEIKRSRGQEP